jgi:hypothetical protein
MGSTIYGATADTVASAGTVSDAAVEKSAGRLEFQSGSQPFAWNPYRFIAKD